jgi:iron-sulfur cluster assembly protein
MARPRPQVMRLSEAAATRIRDVIGKAERPVAGVRVGVKNGGCAGMSYTMEYAESVNPHDEVVEDRGVRLLIEGRQDVVRVCLQQPQPDRGMRLR